MTAWLVYLEYPRQKKSHFYIHPKRGVRLNSHGAKERGGGGGRRDGRSGGSHTQTGIILNAKLMQQFLIFIQL